MFTGIARGLTVAAAALWLAGCSTSNGLSNIFASKSPAADASEAQASVEAPDSAQAADDTTGTVVEQGGVPGKPVKGLLGSDPYDELSLGKKYFRTSNYGLAEKHFRAAVEKHPRDAEAWIGLAASYDRLRRFDLADRAYGQAVGIVGPTVEILNNQGFSYMLRGDYKRAHAALAAAQRKDPGNKYVQNNLRLLEESYRKGKSVE
jgi:Flp pilus assembly protein TadD